MEKKSSLSAICAKASPGWHCSRKAGHDGPCAAHLDELGNYCQMMAVIEACEVVIPELKHCRPGSLLDNFYRIPPRTSNLERWVVVLAYLIIGFIIGILVGAK